MFALLFEVMLLVYFTVYLNVHPVEGIGSAKLFSSCQNSSLYFRAFAVCLNIFIFF